MGTMAQPVVSFPLKLSANGRYLTDSKKKPFLIKEISAWGLIQALSETDEAAFIDSVKAKGFNTLLVSIISFDTRFAGGPPNWQGVAPFNVKWDLSTYNNNYFEHADRFLQMASAKDMLVLLVPVYLGYKGNATEGWWAKLLSPTNSVDKSWQYGKFLGERYKDLNNIIWVAGGDNNAGGELYAHMDTIIRGIRQFDKRHLWTGHFASDNGWATANVLYARYMDIDGLYEWVETDLGKNAPQYNADLLQYDKGKMIFQLDQSYEHDSPHRADNENSQVIRRKNYDGLLSGCAGTSFCPGLPNDPEYTLANWQPLMNTEGMQQAQYCFKLFQSRAWNLLYPLRDDMIITEGRGSYGNVNYVCAARALDHSTFMAYLPDGGTLTVNLSALGVRKAKAWWYDPDGGNALLIGTCTTDHTEQFTAPSSGDWVLVIDNAALKLAAPGMLK